MGINNLILRWTDTKGEDHFKEFDDEKTARQAEKWLLERGATNVDIAIRLNKATPLDTEP